MCGIAGMHRLNGVEAPNLSLLSRELMRGLEMRGRDATGWLTLEDDGNAVIRKDVLPATKFTKRMTRSPKWDIARPRRVRTLMVHTRFATTGRRDAVRDAHPHASGRIAAVHNGTIYNADALFHDHDLPRNTRVDSEVIPALVNHLGWDNAAAAFELMDGGAATALVNQERPRDLILARVQDYPLYYVETDAYIVWGSSPEVIRTAWARAGYEGDLRVGDIKWLNDGQMIRVQDGVITHHEFTPKEPEWKTWASSSSKARVKTRPSPWSKRSQKKRRRGKLAKHERALERAAAQAAEAYAADRQFPDVEEDIAWLMSDGFSRAEAEVIVRDGLEDIMDLVSDETFAEVLEQAMEDDEACGVVVVDAEDENGEAERVNPVYDLDDYREAKRWRGEVVTKSPATLAEEALDA